MHRLLWIFLVLLGVTQALAQGAYPNHPITMVVGFAPGGGTDGVRPCSLQRGRSKQGFEPRPSTIEELARYIEREYETWGRVVKTAGITAN